MKLACFTAGTPIQWEHGSKSIEDIRPGDRVWSRDEHDPAGPVELKVVEEVFERWAQVLELELPGGVKIGTTAEHPFWVVGKGWVNANAISAGDVFVGRDDQEVRVAGVTDTGRWERVYNFRVADWHTYYVGAEEWGCDVWTHNVECTLFVKGAVAGPSGVNSSLKFLLQRWDKGTFPRIIDSIKYHTLKHAGGISAVEYTKKAIAAFKHPSAVKTIVPGLVGSPHSQVIKLKSPLGNGTFTIKGKVLAFSPTLM